MRNIIENSPIGVFIGFVGSGVMLYGWAESTEGLEILGGGIAIFGIVVIFLSIILINLSANEWSENASRKAAMDSKSYIAERARSEQEYWKWRGAATREINAAKASTHKARCRYCNTRITDQESTNCTNCGAPL